MHEEFLVAFGAENRGVDDAHAGQSYRSGGRCHGLYHACVYCRVTDQAATPDFLDGPKVMNGASDLMVTAFADKGRHARTTVGVSVLPLDAAVEVEGMFEVA